MHFPLSQNRQETQTTPRIASATSPTKLFLYSFLIFLETRQTLSPSQNKNNSNIPSKKTQFRLSMEFFHQKCEFKMLVGGSVQTTHYTQTKSHSTETFSLYRYYFSSDMDVEEAPTHCTKFNDHQNENKRHSI